MRQSPEPVRLITRRASTAPRGRGSSCAAERSGMSAERLREAREDAHREAAAFAIFDLAALLILALLSEENDWELLGSATWWLWLVVAFPVLALSARFLVGIGKLERESGRAFSIGLLILLGAGNAAGVFVLVASLTGVGGGDPPAGGQLLAGRRRRGRYRALLD